MSPSLCLDDERGRSMPCLDDDVDVEDVFRTAEVSEAVRRAFFGAMIELPLGVS